MVEHKPMAALIAAVAKHGIVEHERIDDGCGSHASGHDEAVDYHHHAPLGGAEHATYGHGHLKTSKPSQTIDHTIAAAICGKGTGQDVELVADAGAVEPRSGSNAAVERQAGDNVHPHRRRGGVAAEKGI